MSDATGSVQPPIDVAPNGLARVDPHGIKALSVDTPVERTSWGRARSIGRRGDVERRWWERRVGGSRVARLVESEQGSVSVWAANDRCEEHSDDQVDQARKRRVGEKRRLKALVESWDRKGNSAMV